MYKNHCSNPDIVLSNCPKMQEIAFQSIRNQTFSDLGIALDPPWGVNPLFKKSWIRPCNTFVPIQIQGRSQPIEVYIYLEGQLPSIIGRKSEAKHGRHGGLLDVSFRPLRGQRPIKIRLTIVRTHRPPLATRLIYTNTYVCSCCLSKAIS